MRLLKHIISTVLIVFAALGYQAQNIHFSQYEVPQSFLNPAMTGQFSGDWRVGMISREQWRSVTDPYNSAAAFYDQKFYHYSRQLNAGLIVLADQSGAANLTTFKTYLSLAYPIKRGRSLISIGIQPGLVHKYYDNSELTYPSQFDNSTGYFNSDLSSQENPNDFRNITYFDINAGLLWKFHMPKFKPSLGFAVFHITQPSESFSSSQAATESNRLKSRQVIHGNAEVTLDKSFYLKPSFVYHDQNTANMFLIGTDVGLKVGKKNNPIKEVFAGIYVRNGYNRNTDAAIPVFGFQFNRWRVGYSYDINISQLDVATETKGAFELSIIYTAKNSLPKHTTIPCERY